MVNAQSQQVQEVAQQATSLIQQHKELIRQTLGSPPTGTGTSFEVKQEFSPSDVSRLEKSLGISNDDAQTIASFWPVYQLGYQDGMSQGSKS